MIWGTLKHKSGQIFLIISTLLLQEGITALWRGWVPSVIGVIPYVGLNFAVYETLKDHVLSYYGTILLVT